MTSYRNILSAVFCIAPQLQIFNLPSQVHEKICTTTTRNVTISLTVCYHWLLGQIGEIGLLGSIFATKPGGAFLCSNQLHFRSNTDVAFTANTQKWTRYGSVTVRLPDRIWRTYIYRGSSSSFNTKLSTTRSLSAFGLSFCN